MKNTSKILIDGMQVEQLEERLEMAANADSSIVLQTGYHVSES